MINVNDFKSRTEFIQRDNGGTKDCWLIGIDLGYSEIKTASPNGFCCIPAFAIESDSETVCEPNPNFIRYTNLIDNKTWIVGEEAYDLIGDNNTNFSEEVLYPRNRYDSPMFDVCMDVALGLGLQNGKYRERDNSEPIVIQTGLPESYLENDRKFLINKFKGCHHFKLQIGNAKPIEFEFEIEENNISVMSQPMGTLFSACTNKFGELTEAYRRYTQSSTLVFDAGFGTLDIFSVVNTKTSNGQTFADLGMREVLSSACDKINEKYNTNISLVAFLRSLKKGNVVITRFENEEMNTERVEYEELLECASEEVCKQAVARVKTSFALAEYDNLIVTGGTGEAWFDYITNMLKGIKTLEVVKGSNKDDLSCIYSNVRGYFFYKKMILNTESEDK